MTEDRNVHEQYDPPEVEQIPTESGPAVTAAAGSGPGDDRGPEWRPGEEEK